jgi:hypothetical protein
VGQGSEERGQERSTGASDKLLRLQHALGLDHTYLLNCQPTTPYLIHTNQPS